ncbi:hypothetical protein UFOVP208_40 [uncultured Caudovirales phage]|uniref:Uncharacterized protein n=1 Tax=uncultured Caudovirales phage TaxID=2100421 RepID=A0A6J7WJY6_9CAUD|nr:hypothetical protein UFOVP208_40 [uncultured Caudovirales phage]
MPCSLTQNYNLDCRDSVGGLKEVYFIETPNITAITEASGVVTAITKTSGTKFYKYQLVKQTSMFEDALTVNEENGTLYSAQKLSIVLNKMQANTRNEILLLGKNLITAIAADRNGKYFLLGATNGLVVKTAKGETGTKMGDRNGYLIEFDGSEPLMAQEVSSSIITGLLS